MTPWAASGTKITRVRTVLTAPEGRTLVVVKVETSDDGLYGVGCATNAQRAEAVAVAVDEYLAPQLVGRDPADITDIGQGLAQSSYFRSGAVLGPALAGVDMALWDIKGKQAGMPVWQLLGGRCRDVVPVYGHASGGDLEELCDDVSALIDLGYRHVRCQLAVPGVRGTYGIDREQRSLGAGGDTWDPEAYLRTLPRMFARLRDRFGDEVEFLHDVHERVSPIQAVRLAKELEPFRPFFLEDPLAPEDLEWLRMLRAHAAVPIAIGELFTNQAEFLPLIRERLWDFVRVRLASIGGITPARRLAAACELFGVRTSWHGPGDVSPIGHAANLALDVATPNFGIQEQHLFNEAAREVFPGCPVPRHGVLHPSSLPGLGIDLNEAAAAGHPPVPPNSHLAWTQPRLPDGSLQRP